MKIISILAFYFMLFGCKLHSKDKNSAELSFIENPALSLSQLDEEF